MNPHIVTLTAAYNAENWIEQCIMSVFNQTYDNKSIVIVDDCSTDGTISKVISLMVKSAKWFPLKNEEATICQNWIKNVPISLISVKKNGKQGRARNIGIKYAWEGADAFKILDADDYLHPNCLQKHVDAWMVNPGVIGGVYSDYIVRNEQDGYEQREFKESYSRDRLMQECIVSSGALISKDAIKKAGLFDEEVSPVEDYGMFLRISHSHIFSHVPEALWTYRLHGQNATIAGLDQHRKMFPVMVQNYRKWATQPQGYQNANS